MIQISSKTKWITANHFFIKIVVASSGWHWMILCIWSVIFFCLKVSKKLHFFFISILSFDEDVPFRPPLLSAWVCILLIGNIPIVLRSSYLWWFFKLTSVLMLLGFYTIWACFKYLGCFLMMNNDYDWSSWGSISFMLMIATLCLALDLLTNTTSSCFYASPSVFIFNLISELSYFSFSSNFS